MKYDVVKRTGTGSLDFYKMQLSTSFTCPIFFVSRTPDSNMMISYSLYSTNLHNAKESFPSTLNLNRGMLGIFSSASLGYYNGGVQSTYNNTLLDTSFAVIGSELLIGVNVMLGRDEKATVAQQILNVSDTTYTFIVVGY